MNFDENVVVILENYVKELEKIETDLTYEEVLCDKKMTERLEKQKSKLHAVVEKYQQYKKVLNQLQNLSESEKKVFQDEILSNKTMLKNLKTEILSLLSNIKNQYQKVTVEIENKSTESQKLFNFIKNLYSEICVDFGFDCKIVDDIDNNKNDNLVTLSISGESAFEIFKNENGEHKSKNQKVFVLAYPTIESEKMTFDEKDIKIDVFRSNGAGGQNVNKVSTAIRMTHIKTGIVATCQDQRSQFQNRQKALENLKQKVQEKCKIDENLAKKQQKKAYFCKKIIRFYDFDKNIIMDENTKKEIQIDKNQIEELLKTNLIRG